LDREEGFNPDLLIKGLQKYGVCAETLAPYIPRKEPIVPPSDAAIQNAAARSRCELVSIKHWSSDIGFTEQQLQSLRGFLANRQPITATFCWPQGLYDEQITDNHALLIDRNVDGQSKSGHGVILVGYEINKNIAGGGYFIVRNSWGEKFADKGHVAISFDYAKRYGIDAYFVRCGGS
ncbi:MAG TPA: C1 family peptidase, partial [Planctomycetaceae bacterium]|nr:C1 family peptidase [Planctomycetaceae bacterium]